MSSRLKQFVRDHRADFDSEEPSPELWNKIASQLDHSPKKGLLATMNWKRWSAAAAILLVLGAGTFYFINSAGNKAALTQNDGTRNGTDIISDINPTYAKEVYHFTQLIELKQNELKEIEKENPELYKKFVTDINKLDSSYNALKQELPSNPNREQLLEVMIQNLQLQTELLNQQLQIIQQIKQSKNSKNENPGKNI